MSGKQLAVAKAHNSTIYALAVSSDGSMLATASVSVTHRVWQHWQLT